MLKELVQCLVVFRKRVRVDHIEPSRCQRVGADEILPLSLQYPNARPLEPTTLPHMRQDVRMRFNDNVFCGWRVEFLK